jgi:hypothetical protein
VMGVVLLGWQAALPGTGALVVGGGGVVLGAAVYLGTALALRAEELWAIVGRLRR